MTETLQRFIPGATVGSGSSGVTGILFTGKRLFVDDIAISSTRLDRSYQVIPGAAIAGVLGSFTGRNVVADAGNRVRYFHYNDLGTVMAQTKANATVEGVWEPNWCGNYRWRYSASPARPELGLTGKMYDDEAGLYYFNARWYDPERGRWMSEEPLGLTDRIFVGCLMAGVAAVGWAPSALADNDIIIVGGQTDPDQTIIDFVLSVASGPTSITYDTGAAFGGTLTPDDIDRLNQADLIIVTRYAASGTYNNQTWNTSVTTPIILMSSYISRANRWNWFPTSDLTEGNPGTANARNTTFTSVNVLVPDDPAFTVTPLASPPATSCASITRRGSTATPLPARPASPAPSS